MMLLFCLFRLLFCSYDSPAKHRINTQKAFLIIINIEVVKARAWGFSRKGQKRIKFQS
jgi:hypothetical protein